MLVVVKAVRSKTIIWSATKIRQLFITGKNVLSI